MHNAKIGNFVEVKHSFVGPHSKVSHLSYIGDADIDHHVNIGAGTIIANYDGKEKHLTEIEHNAFIGSNSVLVAPVVVERNSIVAAGSVITEDVPGESIGFGRARQVNKPRKM